MIGSGSTRETDRHETDAIRLEQFGLTLAQARERYGKREKARYRKWAETVAFFATDCSFLDIANLVDRSVAQVVHEIHDTWYEDYMLGCIDYIASVAYHGGISST